MRLSWAIVKASVSEVIRDIGVRGRGSNLGPFQKVSADGHPEAISEPLPVPWKNASIWIWMAHILSCLYKAIARNAEASPHGRCISTVWLTMMWPATTQGLGL